MAEAILLRRKALETVSRSTLPERSSRLWRRSDPSAFVPARDVQPGSPVVLSSVSTIPGLRIEALEDSHPPGDLLGSLVGPDHGWFEAFNTAHWSSGLLVRVAAGVELEEPVRISFPAAAASSLPRLLVVLEEGARLTLIEEHRGGGPESRVVGVAESFLAAGARLSHQVHLLWDEACTGHLTRRARLEAGAELESVQVFLGGRTVKVDHGALLAGEGAQGRLFTLALGQGRQHLDLYTLHHHQAPRTSSDMSVKVALAGTSRSIYTGLIRIDESCPGSQAYQENRNLILSPRARADALPELEILTDDVICTHGATLSPLDPEQLFYLRSRGLSEAQAVRLVLMGFFESCLCKVPDAWRVPLEREIARRVERIGAGR